MAMAQPEILRSTIADLRARLDAVPTIQSSTGDIMDEHRRFRAATEAIADHLRSTYGARIHNKAWTNTIRMHGISSSGTAGLDGAMRNWIAAVERRLSADDG